MTIKRSELKVENYTCQAGKLLIKPLKHMVRTVTTTDFEMKEAPEGVDPTSSDYEPEYVPVKKKEKAPYEMQLGEVVSSASEQYLIGSTIVYSIKFAKEFDLFKDTLLLSQHDVMGIIDITAKVENNSTYRSKLAKNGLATDDTVEGMSLG